MKNHQKVNEAYELMVGRDVRPSLDSIHHRQIVNDDSLIFSAINRMKKEPKNVTYLYLPGRFNRTENDGRDDIL